MSPAASSATRARSIALTLLALAVCAGFVRLGFWQWDRWHSSEAAWTSFARGADAAQPLAAGGLDAVRRFQRVSVAGHLDGAHQFLLDNRSYQGRAGYEVLTPLSRADGSVLLVDRGWVPFTGSRAQLPDVSLADDPLVVLTGRAGDLPTPGLARGRAPPASGPWPKLTSFPEPAELASALGKPLGSRILLLDRQAPFGFERDWQPPGMSPLRHLSYAIQWWCLAALVVGVWLVLTIRGSRRPVAS
ncbi:MAG TPA: SURF1 family protein [Steroidobacteraceae bacterium]|nr:SURF1 family protein [Steroidobacteraceae bacterium]